MFTPSLTLDRNDYGLVYGSIFGLFYINFKLEK